MTYKTLLELLHEGRFEEFTYAFSEAHGSFINETDEEGWTLLHHAAESGDISFMQFLISEGADINARSCSGYYPFYITIETGTYTPEIAELFISHGARVGGALHQSVLMQDIALCEHFISTGFDLELTDEFGNTALHNAVVTGNSAITSLLLEKGVNLNCQDISQTTPLHAICADGTIELLPLFLSYNPDLEVKDYNGRTALIFAAGNAFGEAVEALIAQGANLNVQDNFGNTALHYAFENEEIEIAQILIKAGANVQLTNNEGLQPFDLFPEQ